MSTPITRQAEEAYWREVFTTHAAEVESKVSANARDTWQHLRDDLERADNAYEDDEDDESLYEDVQRAWNALVDWVEGNDLNYSSLDPRGSYEPFNPVDEV